MSNLSQEVYSTALSTILRARRMSVAEAADIVAAFHLDTEVDIPRASRHEIAAAMRKLRRFPSRGCEELPKAIERYSVDPVKAGSGVIFYRRSEYGFSPDQLDISGRISESPAVVVSTSTPHHKDSLMEDIYLKSLTDKCIFCGASMKTGTTWTHRYGDMYRLMCPNCRAAGPVGRTKKEALKRYNRRES